MDKLIQIIKDLIQKQFYGIIELQFEAGKIVLIRKSETIKP